MNRPCRALSRRAVVAVLTGGLAAGIVSAPAHAQSYPSQTITLVAPYAPGGVVDMVARLLQPGLEEALGQTVVVENRPGAGGMVGSTSVFRAAPDGYTILLTTNAVMSLNPLIFEEASYDPLADSTPVSIVTTQDLGIAVRSDFEAQTLDELVTLSGQGDGFTFGAAGAPQQIVGAVLTKDTGANLIYIPYNSVGDTLNDLLGGHIDVTIATLPSLMPHVQSGALRLLATSGAERSPQFPDTPTISETLEGMTTGTWLAVVMPPNTPDDILGTVYTALMQVLHNDEVRGRLEATNQTVVATSPEEARARIAGDLAQWRSFLDRVDLDFE
ncbi:MAG: tripartite tricarboxylate transporter substrate binding protein [Rhodobacter sp.]|nr:tripartite tricarboxylate transporter substrate binding protein [Paracoccaceae bacterium]MCC0077253.1 tripartite tricarboxylate transporter substrate binding protein [Rhodobacter sp.]